MENYDLIRKYLLDRGWNPAIVRGMTDKELVVAYNLVTAKEG